VARGHRQRVLARVALAPQQGVDRLLAGRDRPAAALWAPSSSSLTMPRPSREPKEKTAQLEEFGGFQ
jgi:hypothetical protein